MVICCVLILGVLASGMVLKWVTNDWMSMVTHVFLPLVLFLDKRFHIARVGVISYIDVKVAAESGGKDLN